MKLVLLGNPDLDYSWKNDIAKDAGLLGWDVTHFSPKKTSVTKIVYECRNADIFIWAYTHGSHPVGNILQMWRDIKKKGCATVFLHLDLYWGISHRERFIGRTSMWKATDIFTADGGHQKEFASRKVNHHWITPGLGTDSVFRGTPREEFSVHDVIFVGSWSPIAHRYYRKELINWAQKRYGKRFGWYGSGKGLRHVRGDELNDLFASTKVVLGDSASPKSIPPKYYWSDRIPATMGRGGALVHPSVEGMKGQGFINDFNLMTYNHGDLKSLQNIVDTLLEDEDKRNFLIQNAMKTIETYHTWKHKLEYLKEKVYDRKN
jgi:hypothetical protein